MNPRVVVLQRYCGELPALADFAIREEALTPAASGTVRVRTEYLSLDPFTRLQLRAHSRMPPSVPLGAPVPGRGIGVVIESQSAELPVGSRVLGEFGWREVATVPAAGLRPVPAHVPPSQVLSTFGPMGVSALLSLEQGRPEPGQTVLVNAAGGGVGSIAVQLARARGCRVIAVARGAAKCQALAKALSLDTVIDAAGDDFAPALARAAGDSGIHVFLDLVGGTQHDAVLPHLAVGARVVLVGFAAAYHEDVPRYGRPDLILFKRAIVSGYLTGDHLARFPQALEALAGYAQAGQLRVLEHVITGGLDALPAAFRSLFDGSAPLGKQIVAL